MRANTDETVLELLKPMMKSGFPRLWLENNRELVSCRIASPDLTRALDFAWSFGARTWAILWTTAISRATSQARFRMQVGRKE
jgi:hypothetical protein